MDYAKPADVVTAMVDASLKKLALAPRDLLIRGALSGALLGAATTLAFSAAVTTGQPLVGALIFPVSFVMIVLLGLELVTGSFALLPLARLEGKASWNAIVANWSWVFFANLLGSIAYGVLLAIALTNMGTVDTGGRRGPHHPGCRSQDRCQRGARCRRHGQRLRQGHPVQLAGLPRRRDGDDLDLHGRKDRRDLAADLYILRARFEHAVVNMFIIPTGMLLGAKVSLYQWWVWNQIPVTLGNLVGGFVFTGLALYATFKPADIAARRLRRWPLNSR